VNRSVSIAGMADMLPCIFLHSASVRAHGGMNSK